MSTDNISIVDAVDKMLISLSMNNDRDYSYFHASEWDSCHRKLAYQYYEHKGYVNIDSSVVKPNAQLQRIFGNGHYVHDRWRSYFENIGRLYGVWKCTNKSYHLESNHSAVHGKDSKYGIPKPLKCLCGNNEFQYTELGCRDDVTRWGGHFDALIDVTNWTYDHNCNLLPVSDDATIKPEDRFIIVDLKSMNPFQFDKLSSPLPKHNTQMQIYFYLLNLSRGKYIYENKSDQSTKEFWVHRDDAFIDNHKKEAIKLGYIVDYVNDKNQHVLPNRAHASRGHKECLDCKYRFNCWNIK